MVSKTESTAVAISMRNIYLLIIVFFRYLYSFVIKDDAASQIVFKPTVLTETDNYVTMSKNRFLSTFTKITDADRGVIDWNNNIDPAFYSKKILHTTLMEENNRLEPEWKRRILFASTPRGNVAMYYDAYKLGFAYYSDTQCIPYAVLNSVAMKYVVTYKCRDFFVDDLVTPCDQVSPMIKIHINPPKENDEQPNVKSNAFIKETVDAPFANFKQYKPPTSATKQPTALSPAADSKPENVQNRFISRGKMHNFKFIQKPDVISCMSGFSSKLLDNVSSEAKVQREVLNYNAYKKMLELSRGANRDA